MSTILVVDDNRENRALARAALEDEGYRVVEAASGAAAIDAFTAAPADCVLLDVRMPGEDGFAVCARVRSLPGGADVPVVFLTALRDVDTFDRALRAGADDFLTKPVRPTELIVRVHSALKLRRMGAELREQYEVVRRQRDALMRLQLQKEHLTSFLVHDLKNPVASMDLIARMLLRQPDLAPKCTAYAQHLLSEAHALNRMIMNLLDIAKSEEGRLAPSVDDVNLDAMSAEIVDAMTLRAASAGVTLERDIDAPRLRADPDLLRRVLENLVDNAIRHAPEGTAVHLSARETEASVDIVVRDAGPGVAPEQRLTVFERYVQLDAVGERTTRSGRGLGLAFCKLAVEAHGGRIAIEDANPGAAFAVRLPR